MKLELYSSTINAGHFNFRALYQYIVQEEISAGLSDYILQFEVKDKSSAFGSLSFQKKKETFDGDDNSYSLNAAHLREGTCALVIARLAVQLLLPCARSWRKKGKGTLSL